jgi:hypothetical protein
MLVGSRVLASFVAGEGSLDLFIGKGFVDL